MENPYLPIPMRVRRTVIETEDRLLRTLDLGFANGNEREFRFMPGQFCEISVPGKGEAPFGIASSPTEEGFLRFTINKAGVVTSAIHQLSEGDPVGLRGPLGHPYPLQELEGRNVVVIGGGFAFTTLRSLTVYMLHESHRSRFGDLTVIYGARSPGLLLYREELSAWAQRQDVHLHVTVDKGDATWKGREGFVPTVVGEVAPGSENAVTVICGPPIMIRFTLPVLLRLGFPPDRILTSLEMRMKCGIGKCGRCNIGHRYVCKDGPVFTYAELQTLPPEY